MSLEVTDDVSTEIEPSTPATETEETTTQVDPIVEGEGDATQATQDPQVVDAPPAYTPNFKYTVGGKEKEIDEMFRSLITDAETEKKIREVFERADGLDLVKQSRSEIKQQFESFKEQTMPHLQTYDKFVTLRDHGSLEALDAALKVAGIDEEKLFELMVRKLEAEKNPTLQQMHQGMAQNILSSYDQQRQLQSYQQMSEQTHLQSLQNEVQETLAANSETIAQIESILGKEGAIAEEMMNYGALMMQLHNKFVSPKEAFDHAISKFSPFLSKIQPQAPQAAAQAQQPHQAPKTLPIAKGASAGVVKTLPKSIGDLRKMANEVTE